MNWKNYLLYKLLLYYVILYLITTTIIFSLLYAFYRRYKFDKIKNILYNTIEKSSLIGISLILILYGIFNGFKQYHLVIDFLIINLEIIWLNAISSSIIFISGVIITGIMLFYEVQKEENIKFINDGPQITAIIPVYKDGNVLARSVNSLKESNYNNLKIVIACEPDDNETIKVAKEMVSDNVSVIINKSPGSKSGAIDTVVENTDSDYFAVFDADEIIKENFISTGMGVVHKDEYDVFQGRRIPEPTGIIESLAYCERVVYHASYKLVEMTGFQNCRSSSTVFTRSAYNEVGGYDDMLTEDLVFAHKCYRHNISVKQSRNYTSLMEAPHSLKDFWGQRKRWRIGQAEALHRTLKGDITDGIRHRRIISISRMITSILGSIILLVFISKLIVLLILDAYIFYTLPILSIAFVSIIVGYNDYNKGDINNLHYIILASPIVYILFSLLSIKSILEYIFTWDGSWYHVDKNGE